MSWTVAKRDNGWTWWIKWKPTEWLDDLAVLKPEHTVATRDVDGNSVPPPDSMLQLKQTRL
jgi:hypothetical protein